MNDRLAELHDDIPARSPVSPASIREDDASSSDTEMGKSKTKRILRSPKLLSKARAKRTRTNSNTAIKDGNTPALPQSFELDMSRFFQDVETISKRIEGVKSATDQIISLKDKLVIASSEAEELQISHSIRALVDDANTQANECKNLLVSLSEENACLKKEKNAGPEALSAELRMRENLVNTNTRKFVDEMKRYQNAQVQCKTDLKAKVTHQVQLIKPDATDEEVDQIMRSEGGREALYQELILRPRVNHQIEMQLHTVFSKYQAVLSLEAGVAELQQMFLDLALLTEAQGEILDHVEYQVTTAKDYTGNANDELNEAIKIQKRTRRKRCLIILVVAVVIIIIVANMIL